MIVKSITDFETSWEEIKAASDAGRLGELLHDGDMIDVPLKNGECLTLVVKEDVDGNFHFVSRQYINTAPLKEKSSVLKGWEESELRRYLSNEFFALLPDDLQAVIKSTTVEEGIDGGKAETQEKLILFTNDNLYGNFINMCRPLENGLNFDYLKGDCDNA